MSLYRCVVGSAATALWILSAAPAPRAFAAPAPKLVVERTEYDAGKCAATDVLKADFLLRNAGQAPLTILDVKKDCGCTVPTCEPVIPPGKTGHLRVTLRVTGFLGAVEKHVYLE